MGCPVLPRTWCFSPTPQDPSGSRSGREERGGGCRLPEARVARSAPGPTPVPQQTPAPRRGGAGPWTRGVLADLAMPRVLFFFPFASTGYPTCGTVAHDRWR